MRYLPKSPSERRQMLDAIGARPSAHQIGFSSMDTGKGSKEPASCVSMAKNSRDALAKEGVFVNGTGEVATM